jgi:hypothetical protein
MHALARMARAASQNAQEVRAESARRKKQMSPRSIAVQPTGHISSKLEGRLISSKGGRGLFARERVRAGETLLVWGGDVVTGDMLKWMSEEKHRLAVQIEEDLYLVTPNEGPADWVNHSCEPNAGLIGQIVLVALRTIEVGEEICFDYATSDGSPYDEFDCGCGSRLCRGHVTGSDWMLPELQARYRGHFSPYIQRRIDKQGRGSSTARKSVRTAERRVGNLSRRG